MHQYLHTAHGVAVQVFDAEVVDGLSSGTGGEGGDGLLAAVAQEQHIADVQIACIHPASRDGGVCRTLRNVIRLRTLRQFLPAHYRANGVSLNFTRRY